MPNGNLKHEVQCPNCGEKRMVRSDVISRVHNQGLSLICKPCHNRLRFDGRDHPRKGTGVKNDPDLTRTQSSYYKAKRRSKMGAKHHVCYANVEFRFDSLQQLIDCIGIRPEGMTLDRIDPLGHYEPGNVRWATMSQQNLNRLPRGYWQKQNEAMA
ncbi:MAG: HNH endonuclease [Ilumatobacteraceae bacterium]